MGARGKLRTAEGGLLLFWCPGCDGAHNVRPRDGSGRGWSFNGSYDRPTFSPSVLVRGVQPITDAEHAALVRGERVEPRPFVCHSFVTDGQIQFLGDCTHALAGQTVPLPDFDAA
ncbi:ammonia monooxygenase [Methylobacterium variabile]|jgi:hypothetical protein|uniref:Ammonia monooxygenase n=1 Tax=Methylobacterium variabile TaxID=298794 RepID=A0A0J6SHQ9_9HYPH|nr:DUF6527 family protein [Methylobacterium variabile]KMO34765.1 ammonia monooxygenase [Methylobacterium variabile]